jgi:hypothetical protein
VPIAPQGEPALALDQDIAGMNGQERKNGEAGEGKGLHGGAEFTGERRSSFQTVSVESDRDLAANY